jgi:hypothetical protein
MDDKEHITKLEELLDRVLHHAGEQHGHQAIHEEAPPPGVSGPPLAVPQAGLEAPDDEVEPDVHARVTTPPPPPPPMKLNTGENGARSAADDELDWDFTPPTFPAESTTDRELEPAAETPRPFGSGTSDAPPEMDFADDAEGDDDPFESRSRLVSAPPVPTESDVALAGGLEGSAPELEIGELSDDELLATSELLRELDETEDDEEDELEEEPAPSSSRRPRHIPPPESGRQIAAQAATNEPPSGRRSSGPPARDSATETPRAPNARPPQQTSPLTPELTVAPIVPSDDVAAFVGWIPRPRAKSFGEVMGDSLELSQGQVRATRHRCD